MLSANGFYVYGASLFGQALVDFCVSTGTPPAAIIDANPRKSSYRGIEIMRFSEGPFDYSLPVLVTILGYQDVEKSILERGFQSVFATYDVFRMFPDSLKMLNACGFLWMKEPISCQYDDKMIDRVCPLFADQKSADLFLKIISYRKNPRFEDYPIPESYTMYNPPDVPLLYSGDLQILDIGAYDGDTFKMLRNEYGERINKYCAVEASPKNVLLLENTVDELPLSDCEVRIVHGAVGLPAGKSLLINENDSASTVRVVDIENGDDETSGCMIPNVNLIDLSLSDYNFVKMDIEGSDFSALQQMKSYISENRPNLALSVYHEPDDLWKMPLLLDDVSNSGYFLYLRQEGHWLFETQLYAVRK